MSYFKKIQQDVIADANNSSTDNLEVNETFTGTGTTTLGIVGIQVSLKADQNCTVWVDQSPDNSNWDLVDTFNYYAVVGNFGVTVQAINSYLRVRVKNIGIATTTYLRLQTALCPIVEAVPRTLDEDGLFKTRISKIKGDMGKVRISPMGAMKTDEAVRLAGASLDGATVDTNFWASTVVGSGVVTQTGGEMTLTTGATANSSIIVNSVRTARYIGGSPNYYRGNVQCPTVTTLNEGESNVRRWGAFDASNGYFFKASQTNPASTPTLSVVCRKSGDTEVASGNFNGDQGTTYTLDTNCHTYEIWWSNKNAYFLIDDVLIHTVTASTTTAVGTPHLKVGLQTINAGDNNDANTLIVRSSMIMRLGRLETASNWKNVSAAGTAVVLKYGAGRLHLVTNNNNVGSLILYDALSATNPICTVDLTKVLGTLHYDLDFFTGLTYTSSGTGVNVTVVYE